MAEDQTIIEALLRQHIPVTFRARGPSMNPTIRDNDLVQVRPLQDGEPLGYLIVLYRIAGRIALHRLIFNDIITKRCLVTGDAALHGGDWVDRTDLLGVAEWIRHGNRITYPTRFSSRLAGRIRYAIRPLRRLLHMIRRNHLQASDSTP